MFERPAPDPQPHPARDMAIAIGGAPVETTAARPSLTATPLAAATAGAAPVAAPRIGRADPAPALPASRSGAETGAVGAASRVDTEPTYRLVLVSEHRAASAALKEHLTRHGFAVVGHESTPNRAADAARRQRPDVVLIDASVAAGWQSVVAALDGLIARDRVAVLAAYWSTDARRAAASTGIGATLLKGVERGDLVERLRTLAGSA